MQQRLPQARELIGDRSYDNGRFSVELAARGITPFIASTRRWKAPIPQDATLKRQRHRIEIIFGRLKDWRRIAIRCDRCVQTIFQRNHHSCHRHLLVWLMSPEPI